MLCLMKYSRGRRDRDRMVVEFTTTVHGHKYSSPSIFLLYISYKTTLFSKQYFKAISGQIFMKFISRQAEFFEFSLLI